MWVRIPPWVRKVLIPGGLLASRPGSELGARWFDSSLGSLGGGYAFLECVQLRPHHFFQGFGDGIRGRALNPFVAGSIPALGAVGEQGTLTPAREIGAVVAAPTFCELAGW